MSTASASWPKPSSPPTSTSPTTPDSTFRYILTPYPETNCPIKAFDPNRPATERVRIAAGDYEAQAGMAGWTNLLWNDPDDIHRIRQYGQNHSTYWIRWRETVRRAGQILGLDPEVAHQLLSTHAAITAAGARATAVLRHLADTGKVDWNISIVNRPVCTM